MKKFKRSAVVMLTALSIVFSSLVSALVITAEQDTAWDGTIAEKYESGAGNETDPYIIKTAGQLARLINDTDTAGKYYKLSNDITVNEKLTDSALPWYSVAVENGTDAVKGAVFAGHFNGNGHTVSGLYFKGNATDNTYWYAAGLFPRADAAAVIENVGVKNSSFTVTGGGQVGAIIGVYSPKASSAEKYLTVKSCFADGSVSLSCANAGGIAGALNGAAYVYDCYFTGSLSGDTTGAVYASGWSETVHIYRFYSTSRLEKHNNEYYEENSVYSTVTGAGNTVSLADITGKAASGTLSSFDFTKVWATVKDGTPVLRVFGTPEPEDPDDGSWSGKIAEAYAAGDGTQKSPYEIENAEQLARLVNDAETAGKYYKLTADILINKTIGSNSKNWYSVLSDGTGVSFQGNFDGNGHTVSGLYFKGSNDGYWFGVGLFPRIDEGAKIRNVGITNSSITVSGGGTAGALVGYLLKDQSYETSAQRPTVENCYADETVSVSAPRAGGIIGTAIGECQFKNLYFTGSVSGDFNGALYGIHWGNYVLVDYFYSTAPIYLKDGNQLNNVYSTQTGKNESGPRVEPIIVELSAITGAGALDAMPEFDYTGTWKTVDGKTPILRVFEGTEIREDGVWSGITADGYESGSGTESDPYKIATAEQLARLINDTDTKGKYYELTADIKLNDTKNAKWYEKGGNNEWYSVNEDTANHFNGTLDGKGHVVSGLYYGKTPGRDGWRSALFPMIGAGSVIRNVGVVNSYLSGFGNVAAIAAWSRDNGDGTSPVIAGCYADETVMIKGMRTAGIVAAGSLPVNISNCFFTGKMEATEGVKGAMTAYFWSQGISISNCYAVGVGIYYSEDGSSSNYVLKNCYSTVKQNGVTTLSASDMKGTVSKQKSVFKGFDFVSVWSLADGQYPSLRVIPANYGIGAVGEVWSGNVAKGYASGSGTKASPYLIETAAQLARLIKDNDTRGKYYKLTADILLNDTTADNWHESGKNTGANVWFSVNDDKHTQFNGYFEGDGHVVSGIYYNSEPGLDGYRSGLFPMVGEGAVIRNVGVVNSYMSCLSNVGAIVGWSNSEGEGKSANPKSAVVSGCYADETVIIKGMRAGGIVGAGSLSVNIDNCYFTGSLSATCLDDDGKTPISAGIACYFWAPGNNIVNSYSIDYPLYRISGTANFNIRDCYSNVAQANVRTRTKAQMTGAAARKNMPAFDWDKIWKTASKTPMLIKVPEGYQANGYNGKVGEVWSGQVASSFAGGSGTKNDPYLISTGEQLAKFVTGILDKPNKNNVYYKLTTDIYLNDTTADNWKDEARSWYFSTWGQYEASKGFMGVFDGNGHTVSGIYLNVDNDGQVLGGLIPVIGEGGVVKNVGVVNSYLRGYDNKHGYGWIGAICGYSYYWENTIPGTLATISGCFADKSVTVSGQCAGGIIGATPKAMLIENCYFTGTLLSESDGIKGGIVGYNWSGVIESPIRNCYAANAAKDSAIGKCFDTTKCENVYCTVATPSGGSILSLKSMRGANAEKYMTGFDFKNIWYACKDGTPVLRMFGTTSRYSNTSPFDKVCITFITNGGNEIEPIYGEEGEKISWPEVTKRGYEFEGWYVYKELDVEFPLDVFPMNDITLYAKWKSVSIEQGFEKDYDTALLGNDYELYSLGMQGFSFDKVHGGTKSVHRIGKLESDSSFIPFDSSLGELVPGKEYEMTVWVYTENGKDPVKLTLGQIGKASLSAKPKYVQSLTDISADKAGSWQQVSLTFAAGEKYLVITSSGSESIYFDDMVIMPTGKDATPANGAAEPEKNEGHKASHTAIIVSAAVIICAGAAAIVYSVKRRTAKKQ